MFFFFPKADQELLQRFREQGCTAYQGLFASEFVRQGSPRYQLLGAPVGSGKVYVASRIVSYMLKHDMARRVLVLTPSPLTQMWCARLREVDVRSIMVSRQAYRELLAGTLIGESPWRQHSIAVAPIDTAKQDDIAESLAQVHWDLVIIDQAHVLSGPHRLALLKRLVSADAIGRLLLMTATPLPFFRPFLTERGNGGTSPLPNLAFTNWFADLLDWEGKVIVRPPVQWITVEYQRGPDEVEFLQMLCGGLQELTTTQTGEFVQGTLLQRSFQHLRRGAESEASAPYVGIAGQGSQCASDRPRRRYGRPRRRCPFRSVMELDWGKRQRCDQVTRIVSELARTSAFRRETCGSDQASTAVARRLRRQDMRHQFLCGQPQLSPLELYRI